MIEEGDRSEYLKLMSMYTMLLAQAEQDSIVVDVEILDDDEQPDASLNDTTKLDITYEYLDVNVNENEIIPDHAAPIKADLESHAHSGADPGFLNTIFDKIPNPFSWMFNGDVSNDTDTFEWEGPQSAPLFAEDLRGRGLPRNTSEPEVEEQNTGNANGDGHAHDHNHDQQTVVYDSHANGGG